MQNKSKCKCACFPHRVKNVMVTEQYGVLVEDTTAARVHILGGAVHCHPLPP